MLQRLIPVVIALSTILATLASPAHAQRFEEREWDRDRDRHERFEHQRWERDRWERRHGYERPYGYYAPPPVYYAPPLRPYYAPPPIYQTPSFGFSVPFR